MGSGVAQLAVWLLPMTEVYSRLNRNTTLAVSVVLEAAGSWEWDLGGWESDLLADYGGEMAMTW